MISMSDEAQKELEAYFSDKEKQTIRVYMAGGCGGPRLALALDDAGDEDENFENGGFSFCINKELLALVGSVSMDMSPMGFVLQPEFPLAGAEQGGCGGSCCSSGCGGGCH